MTHMFRSDEETTPETAELRRRVTKAEIARSTVLKNDGSMRMIILQKEGSGRMHRKNARAPLRVAHCTPFARALDVRGANLCLLIAFLVVL